ncbi:DUF3520 domain-containing protein [Streptomyces sp. AJS327]|uniref:vWA domain-containing protein n=1 Tax=Streptomyces sp. AJS327 TaxID=2545265 RepID=UPI0015DED355|nr:von Willebrand factor type A domain-containing protein [Streptomyces sp. AJS327]MBA0049715.1 DUF3520 domain-containing protein [Streptomyces sp. AJS327]
MRTTAWRTGVGALLSAALLAGCGLGGGDDTTREAADRGGAPAPPNEAAPAPPGGGYEAGGERRNQERGDAAGEPRTPPDLRSTFALDVDTASYGYASRTLRDGALPRPDTVRTEEFVNSFGQGYAEPEGDGFSVSADGARTTEPGWSLLRVGLATRAESAGEARAAERKPAALTFVLDVSGSMAEKGRLDLVQHSLRLAAEQLSPRDSVSLVTFSDEARTVLPMTRLGERDGGAGRAKLRAAVADLAPRNSTNLGAGVSTGYQEAVKGKRKGGTNRVVLLSDALANTGDTGADSILRSVAEHRKEHGIALFGVGFGSEYGDALMERLTNRGDGHTTYVSSRREAREVFVDQLPRHVELRARDAKAQVEFRRAAVREFRLLGYENRAVRNEDFRNDAVDGGEVGPGHTVTALYAVRLKEGATGRVATSTVRWLDPSTREPRERKRETDAGALRGALWKRGADGGRARDGATSPRLRLAATAAYFAQALRAEDATGERITPRSAPRDTPPGKPNGKPSTLPGAPTLPELRGHARAVARETGDRAATRLARNIARAAKLSARTPEGG